MQLIDRLFAIEEIKRLKARYFRYLDTKDWQDLPSVFCSDAEFDVRAVNSVRQLPTLELRPPLGGDEQIFKGRDAIVAMIRGAVESLYTIHHGHTPEIDVLDSKTARGIWVLEDTLRHPSGKLLLKGFGHYHETYENRGAGWEIKTSRLTRLYLEGESLAIAASERSLSGPCS